VAVAPGIDSGIDKEAADGDPLGSDAGGDRGLLFSPSTSLAVATVTAARRVSIC
jgi:hypothetical protein